MAKDDDTPKAYGPGHPDWERNQRVLKGEVRPEDAQREATQRPSVAAPEFPSLAEPISGPEHVAAMAAQARESDKS